MDHNERKMPPWLPGLMDQIAAGIEGLAAGKHDQRPAWEEELRQIEENIQGWNASLAKPTLPGSVRDAIEKQWAVAIERKEEIGADLAQLLHNGVQAQQLVEPEQVLRRVDRLADVLAANDPTRGNLELSLHIDRITCYRDDRVQLRMCKLGILPDAVELLSTSVVKPAVKENAKASAARARRRGKLRVVEDDAEVDLRAQAEFVADIDRFAGLVDEWFWIDDLMIPESLSWAAENAEAVFRRRQAARLPYAALAKEFGVTPPTIGAALRCYLKAHPDERDEVHLPRGGKRPPKFDLAKFADEARQLWIEGWSKEKLAKKYGCSAPTAGKAIAFAYKREGLTMPTREEAYRNKAEEARRLLDDGKALEEIAAKMKLSDVTVRQYLRDSFAASGQAMPDLRRRKGT